MRARIILLPLIAILTQSLSANDGAYYVSGNHLIPMIETRISVKKEVLGLKRINDYEVQVTVYYEFFNPDNEKSLDVGFEAASPSGDVGAEPEDGQQPYISDFKVLMNDSHLAYQVAIVTDSLYYKNGRFLKKTNKEIQNLMGPGRADFQYVYHFKARFRKGLNIITHTYQCRLSSHIGRNYEFEYILTAAKRWGNRQIDDFTLLVDMGNPEGFRINPTFFDHASEWVIKGSGIARMLYTTLYTGNLFGADSTLQFFIRSGHAAFMKKDFKPEGELYLYAEHALDLGPTFDHKTDLLPFTAINGFTYANDGLSLSILKNLPYARRGYVFRDIELRTYFEKMEWYMPDEHYVPEPGQLSDKEKKWLENLLLRK